MSVAAYMTRPHLTYESREEWLAARRQFIGASESAAILGHGYADQSPYTVWAAKVHPEEGDSLADNERLACGRDLEPGLRAILRRLTNCEVAEPQGHRVDLHDEYPWMGATLDSLVADPEWGWVPGELKNVDSRLHGDWSEDEGYGCPLKFQIQLQHQLAVTGAPGGYLLGLIGGNQPIVRRIPRHEQFISALLFQLEVFWRYVETKTPPPIDGSEATAKAIARLYPDDNGAEVLLPAEAEQWAQVIADSKAVIKGAEEAKRLAENNIKAAIGDSTFGLLPSGGQFSWKTQERGEYVAKASKFRVLRFKG